MTTPEVICKTVAMQNSSQWPCSTCPIPQLRLMGLRTSYIYKIFSGHRVLDPITNPCLGPSSWLHPVSLPKSVISANIHIFFQPFLDAIVNLGRHGPRACSQSSPRSHRGEVTRRNCLPVTSWVEVTPIPLAQSMATAI